HRLMWSSANGSGMRSQCTPGAISRVSAGAGGVACGYWSRDSGVIALYMGRKVGVKFPLSAVNPEFSQIRAARAISMTEPAQAYTIGALAREFDVTPRAIRFYEDEGLIAPRRSGGRRVYGKREHVRLKLILRGKRLGFSLAE